MTLPNETLSDPESEGAIQIDLIDILFELKKHWFIILLCGILGFGLMAVYTKFFVRPVYKSSSQIYIRGSDTVASLADLQIGSSLTSDYAIIFTGRPVLEEMIEALRLDIRAQDLKRWITISNPSGTRILEVGVSCYDPQLAADIANEVVEIGVSRVKEIYTKEPYLLETAIVNPAPTGPNLMKNATLGGFVGLFLILAILLIRYFTYNTIHGVSDVENYMNLPVLSVIPESKGSNYSLRQKKFSRRQA